MFSLRSGHQLGGLDAVDMGDGLQNLKGGVSLSVFDPVHVGITATNQMGQMLVGPFSPQAQFRDHRPKRLLGRIAFALQLIQDFSSHRSSSPPFPKQPS
jgi:hypothetical protein